MRPSSSVLKSEYSSSSSHCKPCRSKSSRSMTRALRNGNLRQKFSRVRHANSSTCFAPMTRRAISMKRMRGRCGSTTRHRLENSRCPTSRQRSALLAAYGENDLARQQIPLGSGTVKVQGSGIPAGHTVWVAGREVPVDPKGNFVAEEILPNGTHTVEVAVLDERATARCIFAIWSSSAGTCSLSVLPTMTISKNSVSAAAKLQQGENAPQPVRFVAGWPIGVLLERQGDVRTGV